MYNFYRGKNSPAVWATIVPVFKKIAQRKQSPNTRKLAQSGHPVSDALVVITFHLFEAST
jgi:hypothetical protein